MEEEAVAEEEEEEEEVARTASRSTGSPRAVRRGATPEAAADADDRAAGFASEARAAEAAVAALPCWDPNTLLRS